MSVSLCVRSRRLDAEDISRALVMLVEINVKLYQRKIVTEAPWRIAWEPDDMAEVATMSDVSILLDRGHGSCGELACAYAAYLAVYKRGSKQLRLLSNGPDAWHVQALRGRLVYDPQILGVNRHAAVAQ